jgi:hypothetical protein
MQSSGNGLWKECYGVTRTETCPIPFLISDEKRDQNTQEKCTAVIGDISVVELPFSSPPTLWDWQQNVLIYLLQFIYVTCFMCLEKGPPPVVPVPQATAVDSEEGCIQRGRNLPQDIPPLLTSKCSDSITTGYGSFGTPAPFLTAISWRREPKLSNVSDGWFHSSVFLSAQICAAAVG